jgi:hypothetical protein
MTALLLVLLAGLPDEGRSGYDAIMVRDPAVPIGRVLRAYIDNANAAEAKYKGKELVLRARVRGVDKGALLLWDPDIDMIAKATFGQVPAAFDEVKAGHLVVLTARVEGLRGRWLQLKETRLRKIEDVPREGPWLQR